MNFNEIIKTNKSNIKNIIKLITKSENSIKDKKTTPEANVIASERQQRIIKAIDSLKPKLRETIMLCEIYGYTYEEAASRLKCPIGTVKSRIYNAKKELAEVLKDLL